ncbi:alpha/beta hydrolase fold domain-containing protein [Amycolatopsis sp. WGS_07]|uniref:alpha/beta hydrolase fold domain-containing protein n=1 Tax=Amycolatopsis sp. WGS_07 TaxID=3076764 RepID=UPI003873648F
MRSTVHPATERDLRSVAGLLTAVRGAADSGAALLGHVAAPAADFATQPWRIGDLANDWVCAPGTGSAGVVLYLHGRRFQYDEPAEVFAAPLSAATGLPVLLTHYRLAPRHPYPAALDDVVAAYRALLAQGFSPHEIVIVGHSAGATLALSALLRLRESGDPMPACAVALSPITDFTLTSTTLTSNADTDVITRDETRQVRGTYLADADPAGAPQSPLHGAAEGLPPLLIGCGDAEVFREDATRFAEKADAAGVDVTLEIYQGMPHGFPLLPTDSGADLLRRVRGFVTEWLGGGTPDAVAQPLTIRRLGWASYEITTERGTRLVIDPYLAGSEGFHTGLPESPIRPAELAGADIVAVTHAGYDHRGQALEIAHAGEAILVSGTATYQAALKAGIPAERLAPTVSGVEFRFRDITIKALPAQHESTMRIDGQIVADQPQSFLVTTDGGSKILCGGDFSLSEQVRTWGDVYRPEIAVLGIGGIRVGAVRVTELPPAEAAIAARWLGVSTVIPVHYTPGDPAPAQLAAELGDTARVAVLEFGETWTAPASLTRAS